MVVVVDVSGGQSVDWAVVGASDARDNKRKRSVMCGASVRRCVGESVRR